MGCTHLLTCPFVSLDGVFFLLLVLFSSFLFGPSFSSLYLPLVLSQPQNCHGGECTTTLTCLIVTSNTCTILPFTHPFSLVFFQLVKNCNEGARAMERTEQLCTLQKQLEFGKKKVRMHGSGAEQAGGWNSCLLLCGWCFHPADLGSNLFTCFG